MSLKKINLTGYLNDTKSLSGSITSLQNLKGDLSSVNKESISVPSDSIKAQIKTVTSSISKQVIIPDKEYNYLSRVIVESISYKKFFNEAGGITIKIG